MKSFLKTYIIVFLFLGLIPPTNSCKNKPVPIILTTANVSGITQTSAVSGGNIKADNKDSVTGRGICWSITTDPKIVNNKTNNGNGAGSFVSNLTGLQPGTVYYVRAYAINNADTIYGSTISFSTQNYGTVTDIDGNVYKTITIGTQIWMAENLRTTRYNDGTAIPLVKDEAAWAGLSTSGYCWYRNEEANFKETYGALYNWYSINTNKLCPMGWQVASDAEWTALTTYLGGESVAGGKLKETGTTYWVDPNSGATNELGYTALPGGFRYYDGKFFDFGFSGYWWSSEESSESRAYFRFMYFDDSNFYRFNNAKKMGLSIRCIKDL
jgi:uncharacterized protein (TIGR02145 family)